MVLTDENVLAAIRREGIKHPVLDIFEQYASQIEQFAQAYRQASAGRERHAYSKDHYGFFADAVEAVGEFSVEPLEIIAIWSKVHEFFIPRYDTAGIFGCAYACATLTEPVWRGTPRYFLEQNEFPEEAVKRSDDVAVYQERLEQIGLRLRQIEVYRTGTELGFKDMAKALRDGNQEVIAVFKQVEEREKRPEYHLLGEIHENFGNGLIPVRMQLDWQTRKLSNAQR